METLYFSATFQKPGTSKSWAYSTYKSYKVNSVFGKTTGMVSLMSGSQLDTSSKTDKADRLHTNWFPREFTDTDAQTWLLENPRDAVLAFNRKKLANGTIEESYDVITIEEHQAILASKKQTSQPSEQPTAQ